MDSLAGTVPPCVAASSPSDRACQKSPTTIHQKLSKPQKRRRRLQRAAVRKSQSHTEDLISNIPFLSHCGAKQVRIESASKNFGNASASELDAGTVLHRLANIEQLLLQLHTSLGCQSSTFPWDLSHSEIPQTMGKDLHRATSEGFALTGKSSMNVLAESFVPRDFQLLQPSQDAREGTSVEGKPTWALEEQFRACPTSYWEALYDKFHQESERTESDALDLDVPDDNALEEVWLPLKEWRKATNLLRLEKSCIRENWKDGMRDYDNMKWYKITPDSWREDVATSVRHTKDIPSDVDGFRQAKVTQFNRRLTGILDVIDAVDNGKLNMPSNARALACKLARSMHTWLSAAPQTEEFDAKIQHMDHMMEEIMKKVSR